MLYFQSNTNYQLIELLKNNHTEISYQDNGSSDYIDSFDWRLFNAGFLCEYRQLEQHNQLILHDLNHSKIVLETTLKKQPYFLEDLPDDWQQQLGNILKMRKLLRLLSLNIEIKKINILNQF